ncbi:hypothetical protein TSOC_008443 [Tetrabaena socialis]|uniref:Uncharacterized protein n=1 Tax=Tetrabaena socialis TaxID=47790 RepID=A0A2J7ZYH8_9CHLO|nr:hypothetical protein TSOC_008443 [Tetrabaena socialis]|eukprot:PNH05315.1 hypothetical protein TSOC_008443 [Tetrabaena socialis]
MALHLPQPSGIKSLNRQRPSRPCISRSRRLAPCCAASPADPPFFPDGPSGPSTSGSSGSAPWWTKINRRAGIRGPEPPLPPDNSRTLNEELIGDRMSRRMEQITKEERQRGKGPYDGGDV